MKKAMDLFFLLFCTISLLDFSSAYVRSSYNNLPVMPKMPFCKHFEWNNCWTHFQQEMDQYQRAMYDFSMRLQQEQRRLANRNWNSIISNSNTNSMGWNSGSSFSSFSTSEGSSNFNIRSVMNINGFEVRSNNGIPISMNSNYQGTKITFHLRAKSFDHHIMGSNQIVLKIVDESGFERKARIKCPKEYKGIRDIQFTKENDRILIFAPLNNNNNNNNHNNNINRRY